MKEVKVTRRIKEQLCAHFKTHGSTLNNVQGDLARVPMSTRQAVFERWKKRPLK